MKSDWKHMPHMNRNRRTRPLAESLANLFAFLVVVAVIVFVFCPSVRTAVGDFLSIPFAVETERAK